MYGMCTLTCGSWHEVRNIHSLRFPRSSWLTWQRFDTVPPHSRVGHSCPVSDQGKKKEGSGSHVCSQCKGSSGSQSTHQRASSVSLLVVLRSWPFLLRLFFQTRLPKGQRRAETRLSQERRGMEGWKWNKDGRSNISFRSLHIFNPVNESNRTLSADVQWFSSMWSTQLFWIIFSCITELDAFFLPLHKSVSANFPQTGI